MEMSLRDVITAIIRTAIAPATHTNPDITTPTTTKRRSNEETNNVETNLYKISSKNWIVTSDVQDEPARFVDVDKACDYLMELGVLDEEIDLALTDMAAKGTVRANFNLNGMFAFSDESGFGS
jgi:hypothetical protein